MALRDIESVRDLSELTPEDINSIASVLGKDLADEKSGIKTNQVRNFFSSIQEIRTSFKAEKQFTEEIHRSLVLLKPKLAYAAGRQKNVKRLYNFVEKAIDTTVSSAKKEKALTTFIDLMEAVVAYHKFNNGRDH